MLGPSETQAMLAQSIEQMLSRQQSVQMLRAGEAKPNLWPLLVELGLPAMELPASFDGLELGFADLAPNFRQIGQALATTYLAEFVVMGGWMVSTSATPLARDVASRVASGEVRVVLAIGEQGDGGDIAFTRTSAVQAGDCWQIDGTKAVVVGGDQATHVIIPAMIAPAEIAPGADDVKGELGLFLVPSETTGLTSHGIAFYDGSSGADFDLRSVTIPADALLARGSEANDLFELALDRGRAALCHEIVGLLEKVNEITLEYIKTRKQFGQPIGSFQTMQHRMADMHMDLELAYSCAELATAAISAGSNPHERMRTISAAMVSICDCARRAGQSAVQAHGGIALTREYTAGHYFKRLTLVERYLGNAEFHAERYISLASA